MCPGLVCPLGGEVCPDLDCFGCCWLACTEMPEILQHQGQCNTANQRVKKNNNNRKKKPRDN